MKRILSTGLAIVLLLGLGTLAVLARPGGASTVLTPTRSASALGAPTSQDGVVDPTAVTAPTTAVYNDFAIPLDVRQQFSTLGLPFDADGLADFVGSGVLQVLHWNPTLTPPQFETWIPEYGVVTNFPLNVGGAYFILASGTPNVLSFIGDVPPKETITNAPLISSYPSCVYNHIIVPLDQDTITDARKLATALGGPDVVAQVLSWNAAATPPQFRIFLPFLDDNITDNFPVKIGYPYMVCLLTGAPSHWP